VTLILALTMAVEVVAAACAAVTIAVMGRVAAGEQVAASALAGIDQRAVPLAVAQTVMWIAAVIAFCLMVGRASRNAHAFGQMALEFTPGWAVGIFFVPVVALWRPYQAVKEIWIASEPRLDIPPVLRGGAVSALLPAWWATFLIHELGGRLAARASRNRHAAADFVVAGYSDVVSAVLTIVASVVAIVLVRALARRQDACQAAVEARRRGPAVA
jgi:hypothetical protein